MLRKFATVWPAPLLLCAVLTGCGSGASQDSEMRQPPQAHTVTAEQAYKTRLGTMYLCWAAALRTDKHADADALAKLLTSFNKKYPDISAQKDKFVYLASKDLEKLEAKGNLEQFYSSACSKQVGRLQEASRQGMLD